MNNGPVEMLLFLKLIENGVKTLLDHWGTQGGFIPRIILMARGLPNFAP
jgi:hypothetical protein